MVKLIKAVYEWIRESVAMGVKHVDLGEKTGYRNILVKILGNETVFMKLSSNHFRLSN